MKYVGLALLAMLPMTAFANDSQIPSFETFFNNLLMLPNYIITLIRYGLMLIAISGFLWALFLIWYSGRMQSGKPPKHISLGQVPATGNLVLIMFLMAFLYAFADGFFIMSQTVKGLTGTSMASPYSVVTYENLNGRDALQVMALHIFTLVNRIMGIVSFYLGFRELKKAGYNKNEHTIPKVLCFWITGALVFNAMWTYDFFVNTLGWDFLRFVF